MYIIGLKHFVIADMYRITRSLLRYATLHVYSIQPFLRDWRRACARSVCDYIHCVAQLERADALCNCRSRSRLLLETQEGDSSETHQRRSVLIRCHCSIYGALQVRLYFKILGHYI